MLLITVRVETQEPVLLLLVGEDVDEGGGPLDAVGVFEFFEEDLDGLAVGGVHGDEVKAFGVLSVNVSIVHCTIVFVLSGITFTSAGVSSV